ncbi:MAG: extracellular solute-binding protein [Chloroflexi bacterium]|nr:extracellular solute-binding protein [Chloroflexota bacterium]
MERPKTMAIGGLLLLLVVLMLACSAQVAPATTIAPPPTTGATSPAVETQSWQKEWDLLQQQARKEGNLTIYSAMGPLVRDTLMKAVKDKFGVNVDILIGRSSELEVRMKRERAAGLFLVDIWMVGKTGVDNLVHEGLIDSLNPAIFLPEALDKKAWWEGDLPWMDESRRYQLALMASPQTPIFVNTNLVPAGEIRSYQDLLNPKFKGKIVIQDPSATGAGNAWFTSAARVFMDLDYMRNLAKQEPVIIKESGLVAEWVARGKSLVGLGIAGDDMTRFKKIGAPVELIIPAEGTYMSTGSSTIAAVNKPPHPYAARLFTNWILTREGGTVLSQAHGYQSSRVDAPTDFLGPESVRKPGVNYVNLSTWKFGNIQEELRPIAREIFNIK